MSAPRVYADFQNLDDASRLRLTCAGTQRDLERQRCWVAAVDWGALRHASDEPAQASGR